MEKAKAAMGVKKNEKRDISQWVGGGFEWLDAGGLVPALAIPWSCHS